MANSTTPRASTHKQVIAPAVGGAIYGYGREFSRYYNCYPIKVDQLGFDPNYYLKPRPPAANFTLGGAVTTEPTQTVLTSCFFDGDYNRLWFCNGRDVVNMFAFNPLSQDLNRLAVDSYKTKIVLFKAADIDRIVIMATDTQSPLGTQIHYYDRGGVYDTTVTLTYVVSDMVTMDGMIFVSGGVVGTTGAQRIYNSTLGDHEEFLMDANFIDAEMEGDRIVALAKHHNHIVAFGGESIEFFYNAEVEVGSPLQRQASYAINFGMYEINVPFVGQDNPSGWSRMEINDDIYFIGAKNKNCNGLWRIRNFRPEKIDLPSIDKKIRSYTYPKLHQYELNGEICLLITDGSGNTHTPVVYIPSLDTVVEFAWSFYPTMTVVVNGFYGTPNTVLFKPSISSSAPYYPIWLSGTTMYWNGSTAISESITGQYWIDYQDFGNNARKHWKYADVIGYFGSNQVGLAYRKDDWGSTNTHVVNLPYITASTYPMGAPLRFRNFGSARRMGFIVFFSGNDDYLMKGLGIAYNQGTD